MKYLIVNLIGGVVLFFAGLALALATNKLLDYLNEKGWDL